MYFALVDTGSGILANLEKIWLMVQVVLGIGLMIFIHELGHFLAAKKVGVLVETFSLGFGPRIWGCTRGETDYRLSAIPLGGYVKMAGENPDESRSDSPRELQNRSASERMVIFSAGVFMNFLFAFITFPIIFSVGVPFINAAAGPVERGGPAWMAGVERGDKILEVNGNTIYEFNDIPLNIALGKPGRNTLLVERDGKEMELDVVPEMNENAGRYQIRMSWPTRYEVAVAPGSAADKAGLLHKDRILSVNGVAAPEWFEEEIVSSGDPLVMEVARITADGETVHALEVVPEEIVSEDSFLIGIQSRFNFVKGVRGDLARAPSGLQKGDFLEKAHGIPIFTHEDLKKALNLLPEEPITFEVLRNEKLQQVTYEAQWRERLHTDLAVITNRETNSVGIMTGGALAQLNDPDVKPGIRIMAVNGQETRRFDEISEMFSEDPGEAVELTIALADRDEQKTLTVKVLPQKGYDTGISFLFDYKVRKLNGPEAIKAGFNCSIYMIKTCYLTLSRIITGDVGSKNLGGIITISRASYSFAELGFAKLFFFLAILSINLGFLNVLPIPMLDGGHLLFLLIEKIKGSPVSEKVMGYSQVVGLAFILALLLYVTYNDILRLL